MILAMFCAQKQEEDQETAEEEEEEEGCEEVLQAQAVFY